MAENKFGVLKNSYAIIDEVVSNINDKIIKGGQLNENPSSFTSYILSVIADLNSTAFFEAYMYKNEIEPSTAIKAKSLFRHLNSDEIANLFAKAAKMEFIIGFPKDEIAKVAIKGPDDHQNTMLQLNKDTKLSIGDRPKFSFIRDIDIFVRKSQNSQYDAKQAQQLGDEYTQGYDYNLYAQYRYDESGFGNSVMPITDNHIQSSLIKYDGVDYFVIFPIMYQVERTYNEYDVKDKERIFKIAYTDHLMGFELYYKTTPDDKLWIKKIGYAEGIHTIDGYNYSLDNISDQKTITISFSNVRGVFKPEAGSQLMVLVFTTKGVEGNFNLPTNTFLNEIDLTMAQDRNIVYQDLLLPIQPIISNRSSESVGGSNDQLDIEKIRENVIAKRQSNSNSILTDNDLKRYVKQEFGMEIVKTRMDVKEIDYSIYGVLKDKSGYVLPTQTAHIQLDLSKIDSFKKKGIRLISPRTKYMSSNTGEVIHPKLSDTEEMDYSSKDYSDYLLNEFNKNSQTQLCFPFFIHLNTTKNLTASVFDLSLNKSLIPIADLYNNQSTSNVSISKVVVYRNPIDEVKAVFSSEKEKTLFPYTFTMTVSLPQDEFAKIRKICIEKLKAGEKSIVLSNYTKKQPDNTKLNFRFNIFLKDENGRYYVNQNRIVIPNNQFESGNSDSAIQNTIQCGFSLYTDNHINDRGEILIDESLKEISNNITTKTAKYINDFTLEIGVLLRYSGDFKNRPKTTKDDLFLLKSDKGAEDKEKQAIDGFYISTIYNVEKITICREITKYFNIIPDLKLNQKDVRQYDKDVYRVYDKDVFQKNKDGNVVEESETLPKIDTNSADVTITRPKILHHRNDVMFRQKPSPTPLNGIVINDDKNEAVLILKKGIGHESGNRWVITSKSDGLHDDDITAFYQDSESRIVGSRTKGILIQDFENKRWVDKKILKWEIKISTTTTSNTIKVLSEELMESVQFTTRFRPTDDSDPIFAVVDNRIYAIDKNYNVELIKNDLIYTSQDTNEPYPITSFSKKDHSTITIGMDGGGIVEYNIINKTFSSSINSQLNQDGGIGLNVTGIAVEGFYQIISTDKGVILTTDNRTNWSTHRSQLNNQAIQFVGVINRVFVAVSQDRLYWYDGVRWENKKLIDIPIKDKFENNTKNLKTPSPIIGLKVVNGTLYIVTKHQVYKTNDLTFESWTIHTHKHGLPTIINEPIFLHKKGDKIKDSKDNDYNINNFSCVLYNVPLIDRGFLNMHNYESVVSYYNQLISNARMVQSRLPDGCYANIGLRNTYKNANYKFFNYRNDEEEFLKNLTLSFSLGVKFSNRGDIDKEFIKQKIRTSIIDYVTEFNDEKFSINYLMDIIKEKVDSIDYLEWYKINDYTIEECQMIYYSNQDDQFKNEVLTVKLEAKLPEERPVSNNDWYKQIEFIPAIQIKEL